MFLLTLSETCEFNNTFIVEVTVPVFEQDCILLRGALNVLPIRNTFQYSAVQCNIPINYDLNNGHLYYSVNKN